MICGSLADCPAIFVIASRFVVPARAGRRDHAAAPQLGGKGRPLEPQQARRRLFVAAGLAQGLVNHAALKLAHDRVEIDAAFGQGCGNMILGGPRGGHHARRQQLGIDYLALAHDRQPFDHIL